MRWLMEVLCVALAGAIGTVARYGLGVGAERLCGNNFPYGTLVVNLAGCFVMGLAGYFGHKTHSVPHYVVTAVTVGFLGGFTTFSAFGNETFRHLEAGRSAIALVNVVANVVLGLVAVWGGNAIAKLMAE
jgi:CrcB protein